MQLSRLLTVSLVYLAFWGGLTCAVSSSAFVQVPVTSAPAEPISGPGLERNRNLYQYLYLYNHRYNYRYKYLYLQLSQRQDASRAHGDNDDFDDHNGQSAGVKSQTQSQAQSNCKALHLLNNVPIFPLRKFPRFPTDRLTLNLYEERYLQMADFILSARPAIFGAIFASGKPHLVTNGGLGPIVPLVQRGDIGTLFFVNDWQDDNVPVTGDGTGSCQRRVRLNAIGFARFRIAGIVSDGTLSHERQSSSTTDCSSSQGCPYIQANLTLLCDQDESLLSNKKSTQEYAKILQSLRKSNQQEDKSLMDPILEFSKIYSKITGDAASEHTSLAASYDELLSFFVVSKILNDKRKSPALMVSYLESQSTRERIERLKD